MENINDEMLKYLYKERKKYKQTLQFDYTIEYEKMLAKEKQELRIKKLNRIIDGK